MYIYIHIHIHSYIHTYVYIHNIGVSTHISVCILPVKTSCMQIYLGGNKAYFQRMTDIASFQYLAIMKTTTTTMTLMIMMIKRAYGMGKFTQQQGDWHHGTS